MQRYAWLVLIALCVGLPPDGMAAEPDSLRWYAGDTHIHTAIHAVSSITERVDEGIAGGLDWLAITRHRRSGAFWKADEVDSAFARNFPRIAPILGMEWDEPPQLGSEDIIILGVNRHSPIPEDSLQAIIDWANAEGGLFIFAHPSPFVFQNIHKWHGYTAFEGYSGSTWNAACEPGGAWDTLLSAGSKLFIVGASDNHEQKYLGQRIVKTYVLAKSNWPEDILNGIRAGRVYASQQDQARLNFQVNGQMMGETVVMNHPDLVVTLSVQAKAPITRIRLIGNGRELWSATPNTLTFDTLLHLFVIEDIRYLRPIIETGTTKTMGNPVFLAQGRDAVRIGAATDTTDLRFYRDPKSAFWRSDQKAAILASDFLQPNRRPIAVHELAGRGRSSADVRAAVTHLLTHSAPTVRLYAAYTLIEMDDPDLVAKLASLTTDADPKVRAYAVRMLAERVKPILLLRRLLHDDQPEVRLWAVRAFERSRAPETERVLIEALDDPDYWVHFAAMEGLIDIAKRDSTVFDHLAARVRTGQLSAAESFRWAGAASRSTIITLLRERYIQSQMSSKELYLALERLGASPAATYQLTSKRTTIPPVIDGQLNDPVWQSNLATLTLVRDDRANTKASDTRAFASYDDRAVYVAFRRATVAADSADTHGVEYVMVSFDTNDNGSIDYSFEIDRDGQVFGWKDGTEAWTKPVHVQSSIRDGAWTVEMAIPYESLERSGPATNEVWGFNIGYGIRGRNTRLSSWAPTFGQPSNARRYGKLVFGE